MKQAKGNNGYSDSLKKEYDKLKSLHKNEKKKAIFYNERIEIKKLVNSSSITFEVDDSYKRDECHSIESAEEMLTYVSRGYTISPMICNRRKRSSSIKIVDGKQTYLVHKCFIQGELYNGNYNKISVIVKEGSDYSTIRLSYKDLKKISGNKKHQYNVDCKKTLDKYLNNYLHYTLYDEEEIRLFKNCNNTVTVTKDKKMHTEFSGFSFFTKVIMGKHCPNFLENYLKLKKGKGNKICMNILLNFIMNKTTYPKAGTNDLKKIKLKHLNTEIIKELGGEVPDIITEKQKIELIKKIINSKCIKRVEGNLKDLEKAICYMNNIDDTFFNKNDFIIVIITCWLSYALGEGKLTPSQLNDKKKFSKKIKSILKYYANSSKKFSCASTDVLKKIHEKFDKEFGKNYDLGKKNINFKSDEKKIFLKENKVCEICYKNKNIEVDHWFSKSNFSIKIPAALCKKHNRSKGDNDIEGIMSLNSPNWNLEEKIRALQLDKVKLGILKEESKNHLKFMKKTDDIKLLEKAIEINNKSKKNIKPKKYIRLIEKTKLFNEKEIERFIK